MAYVYSSTDDARDDKNKRVLYFSFPSDIPQIVTIDDYLYINNLNDLIQMKNEYIGKTVMYYACQGRDTILQLIDLNKEYLGEPTPLTDLNRNSLIYIVIK